MVTLADGTAERRASETMLSRGDRSPITVGEDKAFQAPIT
jgi:hypothetical protein